MEQNDICINPYHYDFVSRYLDCGKRHYCYEYNMAYFGCDQGNKCLDIHAEFPEKLRKKLKN